MNKRNFILSNIFVFIILIIGSVSAQEVPRGKKLYNLIIKGGLVTGGYAPRVTWLPNGSGYIVSERDSVTKRKFFMRVDPVTGEKSRFFNVDRVKAAYKELTGKSKKHLPFMSFKFSPDGKKISFGALSKGLIIYDLDSNKMKQFKPVKFDGPRPKLSPDWTKLAYVKGYDLYCLDLDSGKETRLTEGGREELMNGRPDWVYPEELDQNETFWWSPDNNKIAFMRFDERPVTQYPLVHELTPRGELELERYPKAGDANPVVTLHIVDIRTGKIIDVDTGPDKDVYIVRGKWLPDGRGFTFQRLNRRQNVLELLNTDPQTGKTKLILRDEEKCFINLSFDLRFLRDNKHFLWTSERTGWRQIYLYSMDGTLIRQLTTVNLPVASILDVDEKNGWVYFAGYVNNGLERHLFRVGLSGKGFKRLTSKKGNHWINLAPGGKYFFDSYSSFSTPPRTTLCSGDGTVLRIVSKANAEKLDKLKLQPVEFLTFKAQDHKTDLNGILFKPADFDPNKKYPLLVYVYGGPHFKIIRNRFYNNSYFQAVAQLGYIVFQMDNRGTPGRGKAFETATYLKLGQVDLADQVAGVKYLEQRPYIDSTRVGITGGSYGGYMTCMALLKAPDVYKVGVARSSVTDWRNYDTIYTERYMQRPQDNPDGYDKGSALNYAKNLRGKLLLVHGTVDNNVHPANTIQLVEKLIEADKEFDLMLYPEQRHGIGGAGGKHLRKLSMEYFEKYLRPETE